jgi:hypothetical protein
MADEMEEMYMDEEEEVPGRGGMTFSPYQLKPEQKAMVMKYSASLYIGCLIVLGIVPWIIHYLDIACYKVELVSLRALHIFLL